MSYKSSKLETRKGKRKKKGKEKDVHENWVIGYETSVANGVGVVKILQYKHQYQYPESDSNGVRHLTPKWKHLVCKIYGAENCAAP